MLETINSANLQIGMEQLRILSPYVIVAAGILISMLLCTVPGFSAGSHKTPLFSFTILVLIAAAVADGMNWMKEPVLLFSGTMTLDYLSSYANFILLCANLLVLIISRDYLETAKIHYSEFYPLFLTATLGMMFLAASTELLSLFVSLELMSITVYVLVGIRRFDSWSNEASIKYFVMGGVGAALFLYGVALIYGATGTTHLIELNKLLTDPATASAVSGNPIFIAGLVLLIVGFLFKAAAAPFHMWTPDIYQGAPMNITVMMATALKSVVVISLIRVCMSVLGNNYQWQLASFGHLLHDALWIMAFGTILLGNVVALMQSDFKRLMAYSAIAHTGYLLVGIVSGPVSGYSGILAYLVGYILMNVGAFSVLALLSKGDDKAHTLDSLKGLGKRNPFAAAALSLFLLSLSGFPPTAGFVGKYYLFTNALRAGEIVLVLTGILMSAVSVFYYLRIVVLMYMYEGNEESQSIQHNAPALVYFAIAFCAVLTLNYGIFPGGLIHAAQRAFSF